MYLFRGRAYNPSFGIFQSIDPSYFCGSQTNLYTFCEKNPVNKKDTSSKVAWSIISGITEGVFNVITYGITNPVNEWNAIDVCKEFMV